ncbi:MAG: hypothetical protein WDN02_05305 [Methylovirgula sp.]|uniref:hypothetical protein n=1 Tax=Methylovirgula sp. TaxID=1978224 RepID=UPI003076837E
MNTSHYLTAFALAAALANTATAGWAASRLDTINVSADETSPADRAPALGGKPFVVEHQATGQRFVAHAHGTAENPLADRAAALGGEAFTVKSAEGGRYHAVRQTNAEVSQAAGNPLAERAATLGGKAFTVEQGAAQPAFLARFN